MGLVSFALSETTFFVQVMLTRSNETRLAFPITLVALAVAFLLAVIILTKHERQSVWKTSIYPLLTLPLVDGGSFREGQRADATWKLSQMEALSKRNKSGLFTSSSTYIPLDQIQ